MSTGTSSEIVFLPFPGMPELQVWNLRGGASAWCDECRDDTDHNGAAHRAGLAGR